MPADPAGAAQEENLLLLRITTAAGLMLLLMYVFVCVCVYVVSECAPTRRLPPTSPGKERSALLFLSSPLAAARVEAQLERLLLLLALAGPAGDLMNALLRRRLGCCAADCA